MNLNVLFFGKLREITEVRETGVVINDGSLLTDLVTHLTDRFGKEFADEVEAIKGLRILINGREYFLTGYLESPLKDGDTVIFLPPIAGG